MKNEDLKKVLQICIESSVTPLLWGQHGVGKSQFIKQFCTENNLELVDLRLGQTEAGDLIGMPERDKDKTKWLLPEWFPQKGKGILFLDEINRARPDVLQAIFQLVLDRRLFTHKLPDDWAVFCAANPPTDEYNVVELDHALMNRFLHIKFQPTVEEWLNWAGKNNIDKNIIKLISANSVFLNTDLKWYDSIKIKPTPRSWEMFSHFINKTNDDSSLLEVGMGLVGLEAAKTFLKQRENNFSYIEENDIFNNFKMVKGTINNIIKEKKGNDAIYSLNKRLLNRTIAEMHTMNNAQRINLLDYLLMIPKDLTYGFIKDFSTNHSEDFKKFSQICSTDSVSQKKFHTELFEEIKKGKNA